MRRKRLQHSADMLCHKFCGWELVNSYNQLVKLGSGTLEIDALSGHCRFQSEPIDQLTIAGALNAWLLEDLTNHSIDSENLRCAKLTAELSLSTIESNQRVTHDHHMDQAGRPIAKGAFHRLTIRCRSEVATDEKVYRSEYSDTEEFPHGWPAA
jgi:hypothetical protein